MNHKPWFFGICAFYALAAIMLNLFDPAPESSAAWQRMAAPVAHAPLQTPGVAAWILFAGLLLGGLFLILHLAWKRRDLLQRSNRYAVFAIFIFSIVLAKFAAQKSGLFDGGAPQTTHNTTPAQDVANNKSSNDANEREQLSQQNNSPYSRDSMIQPPSRAPQESTPRVYAFDAAGLSSTTNFFAGRLYADPKTLLSRGGEHKTLIFAPAQPLPDDADTPVGALLSFYDLSTNIQAVVILATLDGKCAPSRSTLLSTSNLLIQQADENFNDLETATHCRFKPVGAGRRMLVNNSDTSLVPRDAWCVITIEADATNPIGMDSLSLGGDGKPRFGGAYWPGRVAEFVFIPRADPDPPHDPIPWDDTLRNALESYLFYKHRFALPGYFSIPPGYDISHAKMDFIENFFDLPRIKIHGTLLMVR